MIASHYASPVARTVQATTALRSQADEGAEAIAQLAAGTRFDLLDDSLGWAWGYAGDERRVGYLPSSALA